MRNPENYFEDEIEITKTVEQVRLIRRYKKPEEKPPATLIGIYAKPKRLRRLIKPIPIELLVIGGILPIVIGGIAWLFYLGNMPWAPLRWLRFAPAITAVALVLRYITTKAKHHSNTE